MSPFDPLLDKIEQVMKREHPFDLEAYRFVMDALHFTVSTLEKQRHITGCELLEGIRQYALREYGPYARTVLNYWGVNQTENFGQMVFDLVEAGILRKQPGDKIEDFKKIYDFKKVFDQYYEFKEEEEASS